MDMFYLMENSSVHTRFLTVAGRKSINKIWLVG